MPAVERSAVDVEPDAGAEGSKAEAAHGVHPVVEAEGFDAKAESTESQADRGKKVTGRRPG